MSKNKLQRRRELTRNFCRDHYKPLKQAILYRLYRQDELKRSEKGSAGFPPESEESENAL